MKEDYKKQLCGQIEKNYLDLEQRILSDIVRRIKKAGKITSTADWQINRLKILGHSSEDIENMIKNTLNLSYPEVFELYDKVIDWEYVRNKDIYEQINTEFIPYEENKELQQLTEGFIRQSNEELRNITQSMGFYVDYGNGKRVMTPLAEIYQGYLDVAMNDIAFGTFDYNTVLRRVVTQLTNSGLRYVDYASGWHNRVDVAARRAVMTGVSQLAGKISDMNAEKLKTEHFEVAWHGGARPEHAKWQGKVWSKKELVTVCGLGTGPGLFGWNCYHEYYPFVKGISERNWSDEWLEEQNRKENTPKTFHGKEYTLYEAKQQQRKMETAMRAQREKVVLLKDGGADPDEVMLARAKYQGQLDEYGRFCKKMGLPQERERIYYDMRGRIAPYREKSRATIERNNYRRTNSLDYMSNSFRPKYVPQKPIHQKNAKILVKKVINSLFDMVAEADSDEKGKAIRLAEKCLRKISKKYPEMSMPKIVVVNFEKHGFNKNAIGGYDKDTGVLYINSVYNTEFKMLEFLNKNKDWFANTSIYSVFLHELGHKFYYDSINAIAEKERICYNDAKKKLDNTIKEHIENTVDFVESISRHCHVNNSRGIYTEVIAECYASDSEKAKALIGLIKEVAKNDVTAIE